MYLPIGRDAGVLLVASPGSIYSLPCVCMWNQVYSDS